MHSTSLAIMVHWSSVTVQQWQWQQCLIDMWILWTAVWEDLGGVGWACQY